MNNHDRIAGILIFAGCAYLFNEANGFPKEPAIFPKIVISLALALSGWMVLRSYFLPKWRDKEYEPFFIHAGRFVLTVTIMGLYIITIDHLGYYTATVFYIPIMSLMLGYRHKWVIASATVAYLGLILVVFDFLFKKQLPQEFFMSWRGF